MVQGEVTRIFCEFILFERKMELILRISRDLNPEPATPKPGLITLDHLTIDPVYRPAIDSVEESMNRVPDIISSCEIPIEADSPTFMRLMRLGHPGSNGSGLRESSLRWSHVARGCEGNFALRSSRVVRSRGAVAVPWVGLA